jgi:hypothetical protein
MANPGAQAGPPPQAAVMQMVTGAWVSQAISAVTRLDVPDLLQAHGPMTARELVERHGVDAKPPLLERALRACASVGVFGEDSAGRFVPTPLSEALTLASPVSVKRFVELIGGRWWGLYGGLVDALRSGQELAREQARDFFEVEAKQHEEFGEAMESRADSTRGVAAHCDLSRSSLLVDVGGGFGHDAVALLRRFPKLSAVVLELPALVPIAERRAARLEPEVRSRLAFVAGDMFAEVPPGDTYLLKAIHHSWDDERCVRLFRNCLARMQGRGRVLSVGNVLPPFGDTRGSGTKLLDLLMMVTSSGRERTEAEWRALHAAAGLEVASIAPFNPATGESVIEGVPRA